MQIFAKPFNLYLKPEFKKKKSLKAFLKHLSKIKLFVIFYLLVALFPLSVKKDWLKFFTFFSYKKSLCCI